MKTQNDTNRTLQSQVLYAPFVKAMDKVKKDPENLSYADFVPKRFALAYDPPTIILEYMVPSTGKLYHHKMRLKHLTKESKIDDMMDYLAQRHPLYWTSPNLKKDQIRRLIERLQFRLKPSTKISAAIPPSGAGSLQPLNSSKAPSNLNKLPNQPTSLSNLSKLPPPTFKSGAALPSVSDLSSAGKENKKGVKFSEPLNFGKDFSKDFSSAYMDVDKEVEDDDEYDEEEDDDFDANELLDLSGLKNKRNAAPLKPLGQPAPDAYTSSNPMSKKFPPMQSSSTSYNNKSSLPPPAAKKPFTAGGGADMAFELESSMTHKDEDDEDCGWGEDDLSDLKKFDYKNTDLNKLNEFQLNRHKQNMDKEFSAKVLKPGDPGFEYDKRIDFSRQMQSAEENSWDEDADNDDYFDDDFD